MKKLLLLLSFICLIGCPSMRSSHGAIAQQSSYYGGGDGSSYEQAVTFPGAKSSADGVPLERRWLSERYPGYRKGQQRIIGKDGKMYDVQHIITATGEAKVVYFDMTSWYGLPELR